VVSGMFAMFFFLTQFFQGVRGFSALDAGLAFFPVTAVMFGAARLAPRIAPRIGNSRLLIGGVFLAVAGMAWLSRITADTAYFPQIAVPMLLLGLGIGTALTPLTTAGVAGVEPKDAGAASGVVNVAQQLGSSLGLGILVTVFAAAGRAAAHHAVGATAALQAHYELAHAVATALRGSTIFLALGLAVVVAVMRRPSVRATEPVVEPVEPAADRAPTPIAAFPPRRTWAPGVEDRFPTPAMRALLDGDVGVGEDRKCS
jgi:MFS family permease